MPPALARIDALGSVVAEHEVVSVLNEHVAAGLEALCRFLRVRFVQLLIVDVYEARLDPDCVARQAGDSLIVARVAYEEVDFGLLNWLPLYDSSDLRWGSPGRGDVIVFDSPVRDQQLVKRVIGLPGDTVRIKAGLVYINDEELDEPYAQEPTECLQTCGDVLVQDGHYFVLGDNRAESVDSRQGWTVARGDVVGRVLFSY